MYSVDPEHGSVDYLLDRNDKIRREPRRVAQELSQVHARRIPNGVLRLRIGTTQGHKHRLSHPLLIRQRARLVLEAWYAKEVV